MHWFGIGVVEIIDAAFGCPEGVDEGLKQTKTLFLSGVVFFIRRLYRCVSCEDV